MKNNSRIVIAGGGTAGWMVAAALAKQMGSFLTITLVESDEIPTVGVGEATIPPIQAFHRLLDINESEFLKATQGTFKLGIDFRNWGAGQSDYFHSFGTTGKEFWAGEFQHFWLRGLEAGVKDSFANYSFEAQAAKANKFALSKGLKINYAYHLDAGLYAKFLRNFSEALGVERIEGKIIEVSKSSESGDIESLILESGKRVGGDFFIDCSGFQGVLIEKALHTGYEDWSHWLPCDRAVAVQSEREYPIVPYTRSIAHEFGWQWRIPLQNRVGNGLVYCSQYASDDQALNVLKNNIGGETRTEPKFIKFRTGRRLKGWNKNCLALGLASGFIEPLESTSIHLIMSGIIRFMKLFPFQKEYDSLRDEYNRQLLNEVVDVRDFIILHYHINSRSDSEFWNHCRQMNIPSSLEHRIDLFKSSARIFKGDNDLFRIDSWAQVMLGQGLIPKQYHPFAKQMTDVDLKKFLNGMNSAISSLVGQLPTQDEFIKTHCLSESSEFSFKERL